MYIATRLVKRVSKTEVEALSLQNFTNEQGRHQSTLSVVVYDCSDIRKRGTFTNLYELFWVEGKLLKEYGVLEVWHEMPEDSIGAVGKKFACCIEFDDEFRL
jgi:hypothetical protein